MRADFVSEVARVLQVKRVDLIEKDLILHQMLTDLSQDEFFAPNFLFNGGTCLIKGYFGYLRFSEDIDFTWKDQSVFNGKSQKKIRKYLSKVINETAEVFERIANKRGLEFKCVKSNTEYVELGGSGKTCTLKIWYDSEVLRARAFVKVQINFVERMYFASKRAQLNGLLTGNHKELDSLFPEYSEYARKIPFAVYDIREILCEKVRALLTREATKARDFIDVYLISKHFARKPEEEQQEIIGKIAFSLKLYAKYRANLKKKVVLLNSEKLFDWGAEKELLLSDIDEADFYKFLGGFEVFLKEVVGALGY